MEVHVWRDMKWYKYDVLKYKQQTHVFRNRLHCCRHVHSLHLPVHRYCMTVIWLPVYPVVLWHIPEDCNYPITISYHCGVDSLQHHLTPMQYNKPEQKINSLVTTPVKLASSILNKHPPKCSLQCFKWSPTSQRKTSTFTTTFTWIQDTNISCIHCLKKLVVRSSLCTQSWKTP